MSETGANSGGGAMRRPDYRIYEGRKTERNLGTGSYKLTQRSVKRSLSIINEMSRNQKRSLINVRDRVYASKLFTMKHRREHANA